MKPADDALIIDTRRSTPIRCSNGPAPISIAAFLA